MLSCIVNSTLLLKATTKSKAESETEKACLELGQAKSPAEISLYLPGDVLGEDVSQVVSRGDLHKINDLGFNGLADIMELKVDVFQEIPMNWIPGKEIRRHVVAEDGDGTGLITQLGDDVVEPFDLM